MRFSHHVVIPSVFSVSTPGWTHHPSSASCPQCRSRLFPDDVRPIHSIRSIVNNLDLHCNNQLRGCDVIITVDRDNKHRGDCDFSPVTCVGCTTVINRVDLADHHLSCTVVLSSLRTSISPDSTQSYLCTDHSTASELACRVAALDLQLKRMKRELDTAEMKNRKLDP